MTANSLNPVDRLRRAPRCCATSKRTRRPCQSPAERGKRVCRFHGARAGAPRGAANGAYRHGRYTITALEGRQATTVLLRDARAGLGRLAECNRGID